MPIIKERMFLPPFKGRVGVGSLYGNLYPSPALPLQGRVTLRLNIVVNI